MAKPKNQWAVALWIAATAFTAAEFVHVVDLSRAGTLSSFMIVTDFLRLTLYPVGVLAGLGALIELVDRIRWEAAQRAK